MKTWAVLYIYMRAERNSTLSNNSKQLQGNRQGQDDDSEKADVSVRPLHPLCWVWKERRENTDQWELHKNT